MMDEDNTPPRTGDLLTIGGGTPPVWPLILIILVLSYLAWVAMP